MSLKFKVPAEYTTEPAKYDYTCSAEVELTALLKSKIAEYHDGKMTRNPFLDFKIDLWRPRSDAIRRELVSARDKLKEALVGDEKLPKHKTIGVDINTSTGFEMLDS